MRFTLKLLRQALPGAWWKEDVGPDHRAILLPRPDRDAYEIAGALGLTFFYPAVPRHRQRYPRFYPDIEYACDTGWNPERRCELPAYVPDVTAGASGPVQLTEWKVRALRVCAVLEIRGSISGKEIRAWELDPRRWTNPMSGWLQPLPGHPGRFTAGPDLKFHLQHPTVFAAVKAEVAKKLENENGAGVV